MVREKKQEPIELLIVKIKLQFGKCLSIAEAAWGLNTWLYIYYDWNYLTTVRQAVNKP